MTTLFASVDLNTTDIKAFVIFPLKKASKKQASKTPLYLHFLVWQLALVSADSCRHLCHQDGGQPSSCHSTLQATKSSSLTIEEGRAAIKSPH